MPGTNPEQVQWTVRCATDSVRHNRCDQSAKKLQPMSKTNKRQWTGDVRSGGERRRRREAPHPKLLDEPRHELRPRDVAADALVDKCRPDKHIAWAASVRLTNGVGAE